MTDSRKKNLGMIWIRTIDAWSLRFDWDHGASNKVKVYSFPRVDSLVPLMWYDPSDPRSQFPDPDLPNGLRP